MTFDTLGLSDQILRAVKERGYKTPTKIQAETIPQILELKDILGGSQTGTGKTAGFMLPILHKIAETKKEEGGRLLRALVLAPTRELAAQVQESIQQYGKYLPLKSTVINGGVPIRPQIMKLRRGVDILVATPGRLLDHVNQKTIDLSSIDTLVLDEADCMLDMGFIHDIRKIISLLPTDRQTLLFSATFSKAIKQLADDFLCDPETVQVASQNAVSDQVKQVVYPIDKGRKPELLEHVITKNDSKQILVFTRTRHGANKVSEKLAKKGIRSAAIHGNKTQAARTKTLSRFKKGNLRVLVATDVAARGLDIDQLPLVVNFDMPTVTTDYIHRIGRTGRAGNEGEAISFVCVDELGQLKDIERLTKKPLSKVMLEGFEVDLTIKPKPTKKKRRNAFSKGKPRARSNEKKRSFKRPKNRRGPKRGHR